MLVLNLRLKMTVECTVMYWAHRFRTGVIWITHDVDQIEKMGDGR